MKCPVCLELDLSITDRQGIEIDYCPKCRGVWLDRGELDKILERSGSQHFDEHDDDDDGGFDLSGNSRYSGGDSQRSSGRAPDQRSNTARGESRERESWFSQLFEWD